MAGDTDEPGTGRGLGSRPSGCQQAGRDTDNPWTLENAGPGPPGPEPLPPQGHKRSPNATLVRRKGRLSLGRHHRRLTKSHSTRAMAIDWGERTP